MRKRKNEVFWAGIAIVFLLTMIAVSFLVAVDPVDKKCKEVFPTLPCPNGGCMTENYSTGYCVIYGCIQPPGWVICYPGQ